MSAALNFEDTFPQLPLPSNGGDSPPGDPRRSYSQADRHEQYADSYSSRDVWNIQCLLERYAGNLCYERYLPGYLFLDVHDRDDTTVRRLCKMMDPKKPWARVKLLRALRKGAKAGWVVFGKEAGRDVIRLTGWTTAKNSTRDQLLDMKRRDNAQQAKWVKDQRCATQARMRSDAALSPATNQDTPTSAPAPGAAKSEAAVARTDAPTKSSCEPTADAGAVSGPLRDLKTVAKTAICRGVYPLPSLGVAYPKEDAPASTPPVPGCVSSHNAFLFPATEESNVRINSLDESEDSRASLGPPLVGLTPSSAVEVKADAPVDLLAPARADVGSATAPAVSPPAAAAPSWSAMVEAKDDGEEMPWLKYQHRPEAPADTEREAPMPAQEPAAAFVATANTKPSPAPRLTHAGALAVATAHAMLATPPDHPDDCSPSPARPEVASQGGPRRGPCLGYVRQNAANGRPVLYTELLGLAQTHGHKLADGPNLTAMYNLGAPYDVMRRAFEQGAEKGRRSAYIYSTARKMLFNGGEAKWQALT